MKTVMKTRILTLSLLILLTLTAISCNQEVIFYDIAREVKLDNAEINGNVYSIVPLAGKLYVQNGDIYEKEKPKDAHGWKRIEKPAEAGNIIRLASDGTYLYALDNGKTVWARSAGVTAWKKITDNVTSLFDNQVMDDSNFTTAGRSAYITILSENQSDPAYVQQEVKLLNGEATPSTVTDPGINSVVEKKDYIKAAASDGTVTVFSSEASICAQGTTLYRAAKNASKVEYKTQGGEWTEGGTLKAGALSICPYGTDKILVGTAKGYEICSIDAAGVPGNGIESETNADSSFGTRAVITIKAFGTSVYTGVVSENSSEYSKLWGYFGNNWNYE